MTALRHCRKMRASSFVRLRGLLSFKRGNLILTQSWRTVVPLLALGATLGWMTGFGGTHLTLRAQDKNSEESATGGSPVLPVPDAPFDGIIGRKASESKSAFPTGVTAPKGAPNILLI